MQRGRHNIFTFGLPRIKLMFLSYLSAVILHTELTISFKILNISKYNEYTYKPVLLVYIYIKVMFVK